MNFHLAELWIESNWELVILWMCDYNIPVAILKKDHNTF